MFYVHIYYYVAIIFARVMIFVCGKSANCYRSDSAPSGVVPLSLASSLFEEGLSKYILEDFNSSLLLVYN